MTTLPSRCAGAAVALLRAVQSSPRPDRNPRPFPIPPNQIESRRLRRQADLDTAFTEAWDRGPAWKQALRLGLSRLDVSTRAAVDAGLAEGIRQLGNDPADYEIEGEVLPYLSKLRRGH